MMIDLKKRMWGQLSLVLAALAIMLPTKSHAYDMTPIVIQLSPTGAGSVQSVILTNTHDVPIAIEVRAFTRTQNPDGTEERAEEDEDLILTPPQMVIAPKASQNFKVRWVGDPSPDAELSYRLVTTQLPIDFRKERAGEVSVNVSMNYRYEAALYIVPPASEPSVKLTGVQPVVDAEGNTLLEVRILSDGTRRAILARPVLTLKSQGGDEVVLEGEDVGAIANQNILVGNERVIRLPWPEGFPVGQVTGNLETEYTVFD